jgi:hypothetical protein
MRTFHPSQDKLGVTFTPDEMLFNIPVAPRHRYAKTAALIWSGIRFRGKCGIGGPDNPRVPELSIRVWEPAGDKAKHRDYDYSGVWPVHYSGKTIICYDSK